jgi:hypothetical protein
MSKIKCPNCGKKTDSSLELCSKCGAVIYGHACEVTDDLHAANMASQTIVRDANEYCGNTNAEQENHDEHDSPNILHTTQTNINEPLPATGGAKQYSKFAQVVPIVIFFIVWCGFAFFAGIMTIVSGGGFVAIMPLAMGVFGATMCVLVVRGIIKGTIKSNVTSTSNPYNSHPTYKLVVTACTDIPEAALLISECILDNEDITTSVSADAVENIKAQLSTLPATFEVEFIDNFDKTRMLEIFKKCGITHYLFKI